MAAERALAVYAYGEAVRLLEQALKVQEVLDPDDKAKRCDLLVALADALIYTSEPRRALDVELPEALSLAEAIGEGGTSLSDNQYRQPDGAGGAYQSLLAVYGRAGQDCLRCGGTVERIVVGQRGTHVCSGCQRLGD